MFTVQIRGCPHFVKLKCIRKKIVPGKSVHYRGCSHFRGVHIPRFHCIHIFIYGFLPYELIAQTSYWYGSVQHNLIKHLSTLFLGLFGQPSNHSEQLQPTQSMESCHLARVAVLMTLK